MDIDVNLNYLAIGVATVAAFIVSSVWYIVFGRQAAEHSNPPSDAATNESRPEIWKMLVEVARSLIVATVLAGIAGQIGIVDWTGAVILGLAMWIGFPVTLFAGAIIWENFPWKLAAIHAGDWLVKLIVIAVIVGVWR